MEIERKLLNRIERATKAFIIAHLGVNMKPSNETDREMLKAHEELLKKLKEQE